MTTGNDEPEVKDVERIELEPAGGENVDDETDETEPDSSQGENDDEEGDDDESDDTDTTKKPTLVKRAPVAAEPQGDDLKPVEGETPRERALRAEVTRLKHEARAGRNEEIVGKDPAPQAQKKEISPEKKAVLGKYKPEEIESLREVVDALAEDFGFVRKGQMETENFVKTSNDELNNFLDKHTEYLPENDKDGTLWEAFKAEYGMFKQPSNPKDFAKIFDKIHREIFNIKPAGDLSKVKAQQEKVKVASHAGAGSKPTITQRKTEGASNGLRLDMLKGFSEEDLADMEG